MRFSQAIDLFVDDMRIDGRITSERSERSYRGTLLKHAEDVGNRDPRTTNRDDVKTTLARWKHPNTQRTCRAHLVSFYRWAMEEGHRKDNPAEQTRRPRKRPVQVYRLTASEVTRFLAAAKTPRERRLAYLGVLAGLRRDELRGLQGRHFQRPGFVWVSSDIAKGGRERYVPVLPELAPVVAEILKNVEPQDYVLPAQRWRDPGVNKNRADMLASPCSPQAVWQQVKRLGVEAGIAAHVHPHLMRHAFADFVARSTSVQVAQHMLGHADLGTTQQYLGAPTLDDLSAAVENLPNRRGDERTFSPTVDRLSIAGKAPTRIELVESASRPLERILRRLWASEALRTAAKGMA